MAWLSNPSSGAGAQPVVIVLGGGAGQGASAASAASNMFLVGGSTTSSTSSNNVDNTGNSSDSPYSQNFVPKNRAALEAFMAVDTDRSNTIEWRELQTALQPFAPRGTKFPGGFC